MITFVNIKRKRKAGYRGVKKWARIEEDYAISKDALDFEKRVVSDSGAIEQLICVHWVCSMLSTL